MHSTLLPSDILDNTEMKINLTASQAEDRAKASYSGTISADTARTELVVYSLESYDNAPVYAYIVRLYGTLESHYVNESVFVNADTGVIMSRFSNSAGVVKTVKGINELGSKEEFPVTPVMEDGELSFELRDDELHIVMMLYEHIDETTLPIIRESDVILGQSKYDKHAISAYSNLIKTISWWRTTFSRDSYDGRGSQVRCFIHRTPEHLMAEWTNTIPEEDMSDLKDYGRIIVDETAKKWNCIHSPAAAFDVLAHEFTHGVFRSVTHTYPSESNEDMKAIHEAYPDIFACIQDENWRKPL